MAEKSKQDEPKGGIRILYENEKYSDLTIECQKRKWKAHRAVLCTQSDYFLRACDSKFAVGTYYVQQRFQPPCQPKQESTPGFFQLDNDDQAIVECMLQFMYQGIYTGIVEAVAKNNEHTMLDVKVYAIAERFGVPELKEYAKGKFGSHATDSWNSDGFSDVIQAVYDMTPETDHGLRDTVIKISGINAPCLMDRGEFKNLLKENNDFEVAVLEQVVQ
ncbi:MAG: hypothetical protein M1835_003025 [Candelina submexicana]|nr:MAG: hypothetical protein M1835_003025 [Candelina submexicana]